MPVVKIKLHDKTHQVVCQEGEEEHLQHLASMFSEKISKLHKSSPNASDLTLYMMAGLMICDELYEHKKKNAQTIENQDTNTEVEEAVTKTLDMVTEHLEYIANKLDK